MPNDTRNILTFQGSKKDICRLFDEVKIDEIGAGSIDFSKVQPIKKEGCRTAAEAWGRKWDAYGFEALDLKANSPIDSEYCKLTAKAYYEVIGPTMVFSTAWRMPIPILEELSKRYPHIKMHCQWADPSLNEAVLAIYHKGKPVEFVHLEEGSAQASELTHRVIDKHSKLYDHIVTHRNKAMELSAMNGMGLTQRLLQRIADIFHLARPEAPTISTATTPSIRPTAPTEGAQPKPIAPAEVQPQSNAQNFDVVIPVNAQTTARVSISLKLEAAQQTCTQRNNTAAPAHDHKKPEPER